MSRELARRVLVISAGATLLLFLATTEVAAATYYVSPGGNDTNLGSAASPWGRPLGGADREREIVRAKEDSEPVPV